jgi:hypothetical protein
MGEGKAPRSQAAATARRGGPMTQSARLTVVDQAHCGRYRSRDREDDQPPSGNNPRITPARVKKQRWRRRQMRQALQGPNWTQILMARSANTSGLSPEAPKSRGAITLLSEDRNGKEYEREPGLSMPPSDARSLCRYRRARMVIAPPRLPRTTA